VNKSFINKPNGIKQNGISRGLLAFFVGLLFLLCGGVSGHAAALKTYTQPFQNNTTSLSGQSVELNTYFIKMDYWQVKRATLNLNFQVSQLSSRQLSDITVSLNNVKFYSFRPGKQTGLQTKSIKIPLRLLQGQNSLKISGQILNAQGKRDYRLAQTPANWLTVDSHSSVNFQYRLMPPTRAIKSFYDHFSGPDTIAGRNASIRVPEEATNAELAASMIVLTGESRVITTENQQIPVTDLADKTAAAADYQVIVGRYQRLPQQFRRQIDRADLRQQGQIRFFSQKGRHYLVVTALTDSLLNKTARFVANSELMQESRQPVENVPSDTQTFTSDLHYQGHYQLTTSADKLTGAGHQERSYFVSLPVDRNNADGSQITLHLRYAKNLDFDSALATVYVNDTAVGSQHLTAKRADNDTFTVKLPKGMALGHSFTVRVALDLPIKQPTNSTNNQTPWASIEPSSDAAIQSAPGNDLLFSNYPNLFLKNSTYDNLVVVRPQHMTGTDYATLTNLFNLIGNYAQSNQGQIRLYDHQPSQDVLKRANVIAFGSAQQNALVSHLNSHLYFKYNQAQTGILSNEKLSIERDYGQHIGTAQLLRSPYNAKKGLLVVTGASSEATYLASTQLNYQRNIAQYSGDAIVVDQDNNHFGYRFKKNKLIDTQVNVRQSLSRHSQLLLYLGVALGIVLIILLALLLLLGKHGRTHQRKTRTRR